MFFFIYKRNKPYQLIRWYIQIKVKEICNLFTLTNDFKLPYVVLSRYVRISVSQLLKAKRIRSLLRYERSSSLVYPAPYCLLALYSEVLVFSVTLSLRESKACSEFTKYHRVTSSFVKKRNHLLSFKVTSCWKCGKIFWCSCKEKFSFPSGKWKGLLLCQKRVFLRNVVQSILETKTGHL